MGRRDDIRGRLEAAEAAKPGPWEVRSGFPSNVYIAGSHHLEGFVAYAPNTADLIAHAPSDLRDLLAVADAAAQALWAKDSIGRTVCSWCLRPPYLGCRPECPSREVRDALDRLDNGGRDA